MGSKKMGQDGAFAPSTKSTQKSSRAIYRLWTAEELSQVASHPEMTSAELAAMIPGRTAKAIARIRERFGRGDRHSSPGCCVVCGIRPVFVESAQAARWGLCAGCYADELARRADERKKLNAARRKMERAEAKGTSGEPRE